MEGEEPDTQTLELLQRLGARSIERQVEDFHRIEKKIRRHYTLLGLLLGGFAVTFPTALETIREGSGTWTCLFAVSYFGLALDGLLGLFCFTMAMRWEVLHVDPLTEGFFDEYSRKDYRRVLVALAKSAEKYRTKNLKVFRARENWAAAGWWTVPIAIVLAGASLVFFTILTL